MHIQIQIGSPIPRHTPNIPKIIPTTAPTEIICVVKSEQNRQSINYLLVRDRVVGCWEEIYQLSQHLSVPYTVQNGLEIVERTYHHRSMVSQGKSWWRGDIKFIRSASNREKAPRLV